MKQPLFLLLLYAASSTACTTSSTSPELVVVQVAEAPAPDVGPTAIYELEVIIRPAPTDCGPEAAITLAQTHSDLALAAITDVHSVEVTTGDPIYIAAIGTAAFGAALEQMAAYRVPECLAPAHTQAVRFFSERSAGYESLAAGDQIGFENHLAQGEAARQEMNAELSARLSAESS